jgi:cytochrome c553
MPRSRILLFLISFLPGGAGQLQAAEPQAGKVPDTIEQRVLACAICHGKQGEGIKKSEFYPRLAGKPAGYLYNQLINFREKRREVPIMTYMVAYLSEPYLQEIAEYYSKLRPPFPPPASAAPKEVLARGETLVTKGDPSRNIPACAACHGEKLTGMEPAIPGLVGLTAGYIIAQLGAWKNGVRHAEPPPDCMEIIALHLSFEDLAAAAEYLGAQSASPDTPPAPANSLKLPIECGSAPQR